MRRRLDGHLELVVFEPVIAELERVLAAKFGFEPQRCGEVEALLRELAVESVAAPVGLVDEVTGDPDDDLILACAIESGSRSWSPVTANTFFQS